MSKNDIQKNNKQKNNKQNYKILQNTPDAKIKIAQSMADTLLLQKIDKELEAEKLEPKLLQEKLTLEQAVKEYQNGNLKSFDYLYAHYKPIFERVSYRYNDDELSQELSIVLYKAALTFDVSCGAKFNTYFWKCARNHMGTLRIRKNAKKRTAENGIVSMQHSFGTRDESDMVVSDYVEDPACLKNYNDSVFELALKDKIYPFLKKDDITAIKMIMQGFTLEEIGKYLGGITAPAVHVKFRRFANKKNIGKQFRELYKLCGS